MFERLGCVSRGSRTLFCSPLMRASSIQTDRLVLIPSSPDLIREALVSDGFLARALDAALPADWPPEFYDADSLTYALDRLASAPE